MKTLYRVTIAGEVKNCISPNITITTQEGIKVKGHILMTDGVFNFVPATDVTKVEIYKDLNQKTGAEIFEEVV